MLGKLTFDGHFRHYKPSEFSSIIFLLMFKAVSNFTAGAYHTCPVVLVHASLASCLTRVFGGHFLWKVGNDVVYVGSVLIRNSLGQGDECKAGKHSQVPRSDVT